MLQRAENSAHFFERASQRAESRKRRKLLHKAAAGYRGEAEAILQIADGLPGRRDRGRGGDADEAADLERLRPLMRRARDGEREALTALQRLVGGPRLPEVVEDPLQRRERGIKLATWRARRNRGLFRLTLGPEGELQQELLMGTPGRDIRAETLAGVPRRKGWIVAVEEVDARGAYQVRQQPSAANGWQVVIRLDDVLAGRGNEMTDIALWALPPK